MLVSVLGSTCRRSACRRWPAIAKACRRPPAGSAARIRAHRNMLENLVLFAALVLAVVATGRQQRDHRAGRAALLLGPARLRGHLPGRPALAAHGELGGQRRRPGADVPASRLTAVHPRMAKVFVSHAKEDAAVAERIAGFLESRGLSCWIAPRDVPGGMEYGAAILQGIEESAVLLLVLSEQSNESQFVHREVERAVSKAKPILPIRIREIAPSGALEFFLSQAQWVDAWQPPIERHLDQLLRAIQVLAGGAPTAGASAQPHAPVKARARTATARRVACGARPRGTGDPRRRAVLGAVAGQGTAQRRRLPGRHLVPADERRCQRHLALHRAGAGSRQRRDHLHALDRPAALRRHRRLDRQGTQPRLHGAARAGGRRAGGLRPGRRKPSRAGGDGDRGS